MRLTRPGARSAGSSATSRRIPSTRARISQAARVRLEVQVARPVAEGLSDEEIDDLDDWRVLETLESGESDRVGAATTTGRVLAKAVTCASRSPVTR